MVLCTSLTPLGAGRKTIYKKGEIVFESSTPGLYNFEAKIAGRYKIFCIAGGAGALRNNLNRSYSYQQVSIGGGSGSGFIGIVYIAAGSIPITVGHGGTGQAFNNNSLNYGVNSPALNGGASSVGSLITAYAATGGSTGRDQMNVSRGGGLPVVNTEIISEELKTAGNNGEARNKTTASVVGGSAVYENYGKGGDVIGTSPQHGTPGYVKIIYLGK